MRSNIFINFGIVRFSKPFYSFDSDSDVVSVTFAPLSLSGWGISKNISIAEARKFSIVDARKFASEALNLLRS